MCTVTLNINENQIRQANPSLTTQEDIARWVQHLLDTCIADMAADRREKLRPYTLEELHARIDKSEQQFATGEYVDFDDMMQELDEEFAREDMKEYELAEAV